MEKTGFEERIDSILQEHASWIRRFKEEEDKLLSQIDFYGSHNLHEEKRISLIKYEYASRIRYRYESIFNEVQNAINDWNS